MNLIEILKDYFSKSKEQTKDQAPEGYCPNCWGTQEYDDQIREMYKDKQIDVNNHQANYAFIQDFVVNHIDGIRLKKGTSSLECPTCKVQYPPESE